jgi:hypothetical protein
MSIHPKEANFVESLLHIFFAFSEDGLHGISNVSEEKGVRPCQFSIGIAILQFTYKRLSSVHLTRFTSPNAPLPSSRTTS